MKTAVTTSLPPLAVNSVEGAERAELCASGELRHLRHHADRQAARHLQRQDRVARPRQVLAKGTQQLAAPCVVESKTAALVVEESSHPLRHLRHKDAGANVPVQQLVPAAGETKEDKRVIPQLENTLRPTCPSALSSPETKEEERRRGRKKEVRRRREKKE